MVVLVTSDMHFIEWPEKEGVPGISEMVQTDKGPKMVVRILSACDSLPHWLEATARPL